jgi:hypothetical protein
MKPNEISTQGSSERNNTQFLVPDPVLVGAPGGPFQAYETIVDYNNS